MSIGADLREIGPGLLSRVVVGAQRARRVRPAPLLVRLTAAAAAFAALVLALPIEAVAAWAGLLVPIALAVALFPRTRWVTLVALLVAGGWLVTTLAFSEPVRAWRLGALMVALYVMHSGAALGAVLPHDGAVAPGVLLRWAGRTGTVLAASLVVGLGGLLASAVLPSARSVVGPIVGSAVAAGLAFLLAWHLRRRP
jgi:hypothetical protein